MKARRDTLCRVTSLSDARYWSVVGQFIDNETKRRGWTDLNFAVTASLSRATIARLKAGAALGEASLAKIEGALDLPRDLLTYIAVGDEAEIADAVSEKDPDLMRWLRKKFADADRIQAATDNVAFARHMFADDPAAIAAAIEAREFEQARAEWQPDPEVVAQPRRRAARPRPKDQPEV